MCGAFWEIGLWRCKCDWIREYTSFKVYYGKYSSYCGRSFIWKSACLIPFPPGLCFLNFTLKNQCALYIPISLASLFGLSSQRQWGLPPFLRGSGKGRKYTDWFISAHQLFWTHQRWRVPAPSQSSLYSEEELHPLLKAHTVPLENDCWAHCLLYRTVPAQSLGPLLPGSLLSELSRGRLEADLLF